jgi:PPOX class probable F420-dependent enzyme
VEAAAARERFAAARSARLASIGPAGPHLVPICFAVAGDTVYSAVDAKPKRTTRLQRLENLAADPRAALLADHYSDEDWSTLWWVRASGRARVLSPGAPEAVAAVDRLVERYAQYREARPAGPVLAVDVERWVGWTAARA